MATGIRLWCHQIEQMREVRPSITSERAFGWHVKDLLGGVEIFDLNSKILVYPIKQPIHVRTVGSGDVSMDELPPL